MILFSLSSKKRNSGVWWNVVELISIKLLVAKVGPCKLCCPLNVCAPILVILYKSNTTSYLFLRSTDCLSFCIRILLSVSLVSRTNFTNASEWIFLISLSLRFSVRSLVIGLNHPASMDWTLLMDKSKNNKFFSPWRAS